MRRILFRKFSARDLYEDDDGEDFNADVNPLDDLPTSGLKADEEEEDENDNVDDVYHQVVGRGVEASEKAATPHLVSENDDSDNSRAVDDGGQGSRLVRSDSISTTQSETDSYGFDEGEKGDECGTLRATLKQNIVIKEDDKTKWPNDDDGYDSSSHLCQKTWRTGCAK